MTTPIVPPVDGDLADPAWAQEITAAVNALLARPGALVGSVSAVTSDSSTFTSETEVQTVTAPLVSGSSYKVCWMPHLIGNTSGALIVARMRENSVVGTAFQSMLIASPTADPGNHGHGGLMVGRFTAVSTGNKTFSFTGTLQSGSGNVRLDAAADRPALAWVEYWYG